MTRYIIDECGQPTEGEDLGLLACDLETEVSPIPENAEKILETLRKVVFLFGLTFNNWR